MTGYDDNRFEPPAPAALVTLRRVRGSLRESGVAKPAYGSGFPVEQALENVATRTTWPLSVAS